MHYKRLLKATIVHCAILFYWLFLYTKSMLVLDGATFNLVSTAVVLTLYLLIYLDISNKNIRNRYFNIYIFMTLVPLALSVTKGIKYSQYLVIISAITIAVYLKKFFVYEKFKDVNIMPFSKSTSKKLGAGTFILAMAIMYMLDLDSFYSNIFFNMIIIILEMFLVLYIRDKERNYEKIFQMYYLSEYISMDRNEFARVIHDDIVQDIFACKNYLSTKNPDLGFVKEILTDLEDKARGIMKYYQSNVYDDIDVGASLEDVFHNIASLYKGKDLDLHMDIDPEAATLKDKKLKRLLLLVSKELVNNIYKHSEGRYLNYSLSMEYGKVLINLESDGATKEDFKKIQDSKRGILILTLLVESNSGKINYDLKGDKLFTQVLMEVREN